MLDGHSKAAAQVVLALSRACAVDVAATDPQCLSFASRRIVQRLQQPESAEALRAWLAVRDRENYYDLIVPSTEHSLVPLKSQELQPHLRAKLVIPDESSIDVALDKHESSAVARRLGIKVPGSTLVRALHELPEQPTYPLAVKPIHSKVLVEGTLRTLTVRICATSAERIQAYRQLLQHGAVVEQEYFRGRGFGVEALFEHGTPRWLFAHERVHEFPLTGGGSTYRRAVEAPEAIIAASVLLLRHLRWHGVAMVEFKVADDGDYRLMEINPRLWGSLPLAVAAGVNFPLGLLQIACGERLDPQPCYRRGFYMRDVTADLRWFMHAGRARWQGRGLSVKSITAGDFAGLLRPLWGQERWDLFRWREPELWIALSRRSLERSWTGLHKLVRRPAS
ncbi:carboxylate--amine ligase [Lysobacter sp. D1-1-M9]|uniref:carboxylate--amine ligase n=1 Tax=Novilysobacter longmucuonensis TaxID=3098603 RepID=UPI002FC6B97B